jgi:uncharacterized protein (DUF952 family)
MSFILHITRTDQWQKAQQAGLYRSDTLDSEGFIHCSEPSQVVWVANQFYRGEPSLVLLCIDPQQVQAEIKYEGIDDGEKFPHIYGEINLEAIVSVLPFEPSSDGSFTLPDQLAIH